MRFSAGDPAGGDGPRVFKFSLLAACAAAAIVFPSAGYAQIAPTREEVTRQDAPAQPAAPQPPRLQVEGGIERAPCALDNPEFANIRFTLRDVVFDGLQGVGADELRQTWARFVGQEQPVRILCDIRDHAATILREAGYIAAVEVPEQRIAEGNVRFRVLMAKLVQVRVRGDAGRAEQIIAGFLGRLTSEPVFNRFQAERYLLLASDLPGYSVRLALRPAGTVPGEVIGDVTVQRIAGLLDVNVQNYGSNALGRWGGLVRGQLFGLTGLGDRTTVSLFTTSDLKEQQTLQVGHDFRIGSEGLAVSGLFTYAWARPDQGEDIDINARTLFATADISYPFIRSQSHSLRGAIGFDYINQDVELDDADASRDRLRVIFARLSGEAASLNYSRATPAEPLWRTFGTLELRRGLDIFNATDCGDAGEDCAVSPSRPEADGTATVVRGSLHGEYRPARKVTLSLGLLGQWANDPLLTFEEFSAGNYTAGRGYDPGAIIGDRGVGLQAELRVGSLIPRDARSIAAEPYLFFDYARIRDEDTEVLPGRRNLSSAGGGVRTTWGDKLRLDLAVAVPLEKIGIEDERPDPRVLLSITTRLWPWSF
jgi:hemolysin activation/secretion protein